jgi:CubicO group peptidase (beta-lactamase class C family)
MVAMPTSETKSTWEHVRPFPAQEVTVRNWQSEVDPKSVGLTRHDVDDIWAAVVRLYEMRVHPAISLCIRRRGKVILDRSIGHRSGNSPGDPLSAPKVQATPDTLFNVYSASKSVTAMLIHLLDERGLVHLDDPVAEYLPEFGKNGKQWITLRHVLTHRSGIPAVPKFPGPTVDLLSQPQKIFELLCEAKPVSRAGQRLAYHAITGGYVLGAVVEKVTGQDLRAFLRSEILDPLGFKHMNYGVPEADIPNVAVNAFTGPPALPPYSWILEKSLGVTLRQAAEIGNHKNFLTSVIPAGNVVATANEMCRFFQLLLEDGTLDGKQIFQRRTVRRAVAEQSFYEFDAVMMVPVRYGMGFMLGSKWLSLYGHDTASAFGHLGFTSILAYADPARDISVAFLASGKPFLTPEQVAWIAVPRTIARVTAK